jgi:Fur family peroxide stress response transcriptional regulator
MRTAAFITRKHSKKRDAILEILRSTKTHPTAAWVYDRAKRAIPDLSLGTVYRNLSQFRDEGEVISVGVVDGEERFDGRLAPHPHLVCEKCGAVLDIDDEDPSAFKQYTQDYNIPIGADFTIDFRKTVFYGKCKICRSDATIT